MSGWFDPSGRNISSAKTASGSRKSGNIPILQGHFVIPSVSPSGGMLGIGGDYVRQTDKNNNHNFESSPSKPFGSALGDALGIGIGDQSHNKQNKQKQNDSGFRDVFWGILFYLQLGVILAVTIIYAPRAMDSSIQNFASNVGERRKRSRMLEGEYMQEETTGFEIDPGRLVLVLAVAGVLGLTLSSLSLGLMRNQAQLLIKISLFFNVSVFGVIAILSLLSGTIFYALIAACMCGMAAWYAITIWDRIPFAASNMIAAVTAVRCNMGLTLYAYLSTLYIFIWSIWWTIATGSTLLVLRNCDDGGDCANDINLGVLFLFFVSFYWTIQVIVNVVHVTTAGTVGTWWFAPIEANGCCSEAVRISYIRSLTTSFGSICFGSLIVAIIQAIKETVYSIRESGDDQLLLCLAECILGCIESLVEYFNKWAFVYVGLYGFSFMEAGNNAMILFRERGWTSIITDNIVDTVLLMLAVGVGVLVALLIALLFLIVSSTSTSSIVTVMIVSFVLGYSMCATLLSVVSSAVNTIIVCYAEAPNEFQTNHPQLAMDMKESWRNAFPDEFLY